MRSLLAAAGLLVAALISAAPAGAVGGRAVGTQLSPVADRYEPGQVATMVGYTGRGAYGWVDDGPFSAFLAPAGAGSGTGRYLGELAVGRTGHEGWRALRVAISFPVPADLAPGAYRLYYCNTPCTTGLGDLEGGTLAVGTDPAAPVLRAWSLDEPEIARVPGDAVITGPGYEVLASVLREGELSGRAPARAAPAPSPPSTRAPVAAPPPPERPAPAPFNRGWLAFGAGFAALCAASVLMALRQPGGTGRLATP